MSSISTEEFAGKTKNVQNYISATYPDGHAQVLFTPLAPFETEEALDKMINKEKIRLMTQAAAYESSGLQRDSFAKRYYKKDYVGLEKLKSKIWFMDMRISL